MKTKKKTGKKKRSLASKIFLSLLSALAAAVVIYLVYYFTSDTGIFERSKRKQAEALYEAVMFTDYPSTPEAVMEIYAKTVFLLYGEMIKDDEVFRAVLKRQRELLAEDLLALNSFENQYEKLTETLAELKDLKTTAIKVELVDCKRVSDKEYRAVIKQSFTRLLPYTMTYRIILENDRWKILSFSA